MTDTLLAIMTLLTPLTPLTLLASLLLGITIWVSTTATICTIFGYKVNYASYLARIDHFLVVALHSTQSI
jgi:hypothetical protein